MDKYVVQKNVLHGKYSPGQTGTIVYRPILSFYLCPYYDRISPCRIGRNTVVYGEKNDRIRTLYTGVRMRCPFFFVFLYLPLFFSLYGHEDI